MTIQLGKEKGISKEGSWSKHWLRQLLLLSFTTTPLFTATHLFLSITTTTTTTTTTISIAKWIR